MLVKSGTFRGLQRNAYKVIYADPPWTFQTYSEVGKDRSAEVHYACMSLQDIKRLPVAELAAPDCVLFLWTTDPMIPEALRVMKAWGFTYKTVAFCWVKTNRKSDGYFTGMGYWTRANPELCLLGTVGKPKRVHKGVPRLIVSPRREHSRKPDEVRKRIAQLVVGPYIELFGRTSVAGWDVWGNEITKFTKFNER